MIKSYSIVFLFLLLGACSPLDKERNKEAQNKKTIESYVDMIWNNKELDSLEIYFSNPFKRNVNNIRVATDRVELTANLNILFASFPDLHMDIEYLMAARNKVFMNWALTGTNMGEFSDHPATGKKIKISGITEMDLNEYGMITYENITFNELSLMQQLGYKLIIPKDQEIDSNINQN